MAPGGSANSSVGQLGPCGYTRWNGLEHHQSAESVGTPEEKENLLLPERNKSQSLSLSLSPSVFVWQRSVFSKASAVTQTFGRHWRLPGEAEAGVRVEEGNVQCSLLPVLLTAAAAAPGGSKTSIQNRGTRTLHACIVTPSIKFNRNHHCIHNSVHTGGLRSRKVRGAAAGGLCLRR